MKNSSESSDSNQSKTCVLVPPVTNLPSTVTYVEGPSNSQVNVFESTWLVNHEVLYLIISNK